MDDLSTKLDQLYQEQLDSAQVLRRAIAGLHTTRTRAEEQLERLRQKTAETASLHQQAIADGRTDMAEEHSAALAELRRLTAEAGSDVQSAMESEQTSIRMSELLYFKMDKFRSAKEVFKARMLSAELSIQISEVGAALDRLIEGLGKGPEQP